MRDDDFEAFIAEHLAGFPVIVRQNLIWSSGKEVRAFEGHTDSIVSLSVSSDGKCMIAGSFDGTARLWDIATGKQIRVFQK